MSESASRGNVIRSVRSPTFAALENPDFRRYLHGAGDQPGRNLASGCGRALACF